MQRPERTAIATGQSIGLEDKKLTASRRSSRARRAVLAILVALALPPAGCRREGPRRPLDPPPPRGKALVATIRAEPRTFNRFAGRDSILELFTPPDAGAARARRPPDAGGRAVARGVVDRVGRRPDLHPHAAPRRHLLGRHAVHVGGRACSRSARSYDEKTRQPARRLAARWAASRSRSSAPDAGDGRRDVPVAVRSRDSGCSTTCRSSRGTSWRRRWRRARSAKAWDVSTPPSEMPGLGPFVLAALPAGPAAGLRAQPALLADGRARAAGCRFSTG